ncbi:dipeptide/oligopeptide ABC transporter permease 5 [Thermococcus cleftensis]|uniref:Dipeptide/oligopeptide ABC transporter permease 5 n=1 Tax=Thermococcus cleftensis (strain DSM 27260 / KACC 17922 / CL1) TaxID=163003 RepID=I3ZUI5_THECF|nr:ABC transporter permease subunit [Thermococcus cleftensis]AFL95369.1 dipeptide/oligopeptide ABC transporter permease 5 [Thermococcus cleftensis]
MGRAISRALLNYLLLILLVALISGIGIKDYSFYRADMKFSLMPPAERAVIEANASSMGMDPYDYYMRFVAPKDYPTLAMNPLHAGLYVLYHSLFDPDYDYPVPRKLMVVRTLVLTLLAEITIILIGFPLAKLALRKRRLRSTVRFLARVFNGLPVWAVAALFSLLIIMSALPNYLINGLGASTSLTRNLAYMAFPLISIVLVALWEFVEALVILLRDEFGKEYVRAKRAMGLPERRVERHVLRAVMPSFLGFLFQHFVEVSTLALVVDAFFGLFGLGKMLEWGFRISGDLYTLDPDVFFYPIAVFMVVNFFVLLAVTLLSELLTPGGGGVEA